MNIEDLDFTMHGRFLGENIIGSRITWDGIDLNRYFKPHRQETIDYLKLKDLYKETEEVTTTPYLSFIEENKTPFSLKTENSSKNWNGKIYYSNNTTD